jgi:ACS family hexuronate transporter-like MFS transporter
VPKRQIKNLRWIIAGLIFINTVVNYADRQTLSVLAPDITRELHISNIAYGYIVQAFLIAYTAMFVFAGLLIDRWGVKLVYGAATAWWSVAEILHAVARSSIGLGAMRFLLGIGESFNFIASTAVVSEWYPPKERALLNGLANSAAVTGAIVTPPIVVWLALKWGWHSAFIVTGALGFVWLIGWLALYYVPEKHPYVTTGELAIVQDRGGPAAPKTTTRWLDLLQSRAVWGLILARLLSDPVWWFYLFWLPKYLTDSRGMSMAQMASVVWVPYLASDIGSIVGGWCSGVLVRLGWDTVPARRAVMVASVALMPVGIAVAWVHSSLLTIALMCLVLFAHMSWKTNLMTLTNDIFSRPIVGSVGGILSTGSGAGGALFTMLVGYLVQSYSYVPVFVMMGFMHPISYLFVHWMVRKQEKRIVQPEPVHG